VSRDKREKKDQNLEPIRGKCGETQDVLFQKEKSGKSGIRQKRGAQKEPILKVCERFAVGENYDHAGKTEQRRKKVEEKIADEKTRKCRTPPCTHWQAEIFTHGRIDS